MMRTAPIITPDGVREALDLARECYDALDDASARGRESFRRATDFSRVMGGLLAGELKLYGCGDPDLRAMIAVRDGDHIMLLFVEREYRRRQLGTALVERAIADAQESGISTISVNATPSSTAFYEKLGFRATAAPQERDGIAFVEMSLDL